MSCMYVYVYVHSISNPIHFANHNQLVPILNTTSKQSITKHTHTSRIYIYIRIYILRMYVCMFSSNPFNHNHFPNIQITIKLETIEIRLQNYNRNGKYYVI